MTIPDHETTYPDTPETFIRMKPGAARRVAKALLKVMDGKWGSEFRALLRGVYHMRAWEVDSLHKTYPDMTLPDWLMVFVNAPPPRDYAALTEIALTDFIATAMEGGEE